MASTDVTPIPPASDGSGFGGGRREDTGPLIQRPADLVELSERVYRGVFGTGLAVAATTTLATLLAAPLQPAGQRTIAIAVCAALLVGQLAAVRRATRLYAALRRRPWLVLVPAVGLGGGAWAMGPHNQLLFYTVTILLDVLGAAVPLRWIAVASLLAAAGMAAPQLIASTGGIGVAAVAGILPPLFWLVIEQLARFMLGLHQTQPKPQGLRRVRVTNWAGNAKTSTSRPTPLRLLARGHSPLSNDQLRILLLTAEGLTNVQVADCLPIGAQQVRRQLRAARLAAGVATNAELVAWGIRCGLIPVSDGAWRGHVDGADHTICADPQM